VLKRNKELITEEGTKQKKNHYDEMKGKGRK
jgi:hypothetical protein